MLCTMLKSKFHHATITDVELEYEGSLTIDSELMEIAQIRQYEKILVANLANGNRLETYAIAAPAGSGKFCLNGATAHKGSVGDKVIIFTFCQIEEEDVPNHRPLVVLMGKNNKPKEIKKG